MSATQAENKQTALWARVVAGGTFFCLGLAEPEARTLGLQQGN